MGFLISAASFIAFFSIFAFFGSVSPQVNRGNNMFLYMFGGTVTDNTRYYSYVDVYPRIGGMTFLFVLQILIMLVSLVAFYYGCKRSSDAKIMLGISIMGGLMSLLALILSFNSIKMIGLKSAKLGFGPIFYSILHILSCLAYILVIFLYKSESNNRPCRSTKTTTHISNKSNLNQKLTEKEAEEKIEINRMLLQKGVITRAEFDKRINQIRSNCSTIKQEAKIEKMLSEDEKIELILKYKKMVEEGVITQDEFEIKKKKLLE